MKKNVAQFRMVSAAVLMFSCFTAPVFGQDVQDYEVPSEDSSSFKPKKSQVSSFFQQNKTTQNFFENKNISANSMFGGVAGSSIVNLPGPDAEVKSVQESEPVHQEIQVEQQKEVQEKVEIVSDSSVKNGQDIDEESTVSRTSGELDSGMKDVMEHSRKIREAIFGASAAEKLPVAITEKLKAKSPASDSNSSRF